MPKQLCVAISLSAAEKSRLDALRKKLGCSRTEVVGLALRQLLDHSEEKEPSWKSGASGI